MAHSLRSPYTVQAVRPTRHWWRCPRVLAWFRVLMVWSLVKPPTSVGPLSRIGDYLFAAPGPGLFLRIRRRTTFPPKSAVTRGPPHPLFHRRCGTERRPGSGTTLRLPPLQPCPHALPRHYSPCRPPLTRGLVTKAAPTWLASRQFQVSRRPPSLDW